MLSSEPRRPNRLFLRLLIALALLSMSWAFGCNNQTPPKETPPKPVREKPAMVTAADTALPICEIDEVESCEVESVHPAGTIYRCDRCKDGAPCETCRKAHDCENCGHKPCRCRLHAE